MVFRIVGCVSKIVPGAHSENIGSSIHKVWWYLKWRKFGLPANSNAASLLAKLQNFLNSGIPSIKGRTVQFHLLLKVIGNLWPYYGILTKFAKIASSGTSSPANHLSVVVSINSFNFFVKVDKTTCSRLSAGITAVFFHSPFMAS